MGPLLGEGGYGQVFRARTVEAPGPAGPLCIKLTRHQQSWLREAYFGALLRGQARAIAVYDSFPWWDGTGRPLYALVLEFAPMGDLRSYFAAGHRPFSETRARSQVAGLLEVLQILHRGRALHRDLTPLNIFVCEGPTLKLGDFGIAMHHVRTGGVAATTMAPWMAPPEVLQQRAQTWRAADDVYQVGQLLAMLVKGEATRKLTSTEVARLPCSDQFKEIVQRCIGPRPKRFASASELTAALKAEPDRATSGRVASLRGLQIVFTGRLDSMTRPDAARRARRAGARVGARVTASTDVVVRGQPSPGQKAGRKGTKLMDVDYYRERGNRIRIINEAAFIRLIRAPGARRS